MKRKNIRFLPLLLTAVLLVTTGGVPVFAQTVSDNRAAEEEKEATDTSFSDFILGENGAVSENTVSGQALQEVQAGVVTGPANPIHHCTKKNDGSDYTDFCYVYFGSYPQSEVTDEAVITAIDKAVSTSGTSADAGMDVWVNGIKYRRISEKDTNTELFFDDMPNYNGYRYFKWERIKWKVLQNDGKTLFVVADKALDCKKYNEKKQVVTWENSTVRNWLNNQFYAVAFQEKEQNAIEIQHVINEDNPEEGTEGGNDTEDKVYLLSMGEVQNPIYGYCSDSKVFSMGRKVKASDYANARGCQIGSGDKDMDNCDWWLRSPGANSSDWGYHVADVMRKGQFSSYGTYVDNYTSGVCPALHINLASSLWEMVNDDFNGNGEEGKKEPEKPEKSEKPKEIKVTKLTIKGPSGKLAAGKKAVLTLQVFPENAANKAVSFQSSNSKYASVDQSGKITVKKAGAGKNVTITASALDGSQVKASYKFKIMKHAVKKITLKAPAKTLKNGKSMTIKATIKTTGKSANKSLKWTSSNKKYATVNSKGKVTAKKAGKGKTITITAAAVDGSGKKGTVKIKIK